MGEQEAELRGEIKADKGAIKDMEKIVAHGKDELKKDEAALKKLKEKKKPVAKK